jgi:hypothetical protein
MRLACSFRMLSPALIPVNPPLNGNFRSFLII